MANAQGSNGTEEFDEVAEVAATCRIHWRFADVPDAKADEMEEELEAHLREAVANGRSIGDVVGDDEVAFADQWAREAQTKRDVPGWLFEIGWALSLAIAFTSAAYHLLRWTLSFQVESALITPVMLGCYGALLVRIRGLPGRNRAREKSKQVVRGLAVGVVVLVPTFMAWAITGERNAELFEWHWIYTLAAVGAAVVLGPLAKRSVGQK